MSENKPVELVTCTIDGQQVSVPKGTLIIRAAESVSYTHLTLPTSDLV